MKRFLSFVCSLVLVLSLFLGGCSADPTNLTGNFRQDTLALIDSLRTAITVPDDSADKKVAQADARTKINSFIARYRRDDSLTSLASFTTMRTALNSLAGHYSSYPNRPLPDKLKKRLEQEFQQVELALSREPAA
ncbi:MAG: photosystem II protein Psb27 [Aphanocapsa sp. GSE-SYN-MK-11-07L]|jgi:photosystem II Psb27 protein|nr:photosystem II protein Psb27 [Aphanocapsa sp. GSE-SYN-MK-11-07L]